MSKIAGPQDEVSAYRPKAAPFLPLNLARQLGLDKNVVPVAVAQGKNEFGQVCTVTELMIVVKPGASLREVHYATGIALAELQKQSGIKDPDMIFALPIFISRKLSRDVFERVASDGKEERLAADPLRVWTKRKGLNGATFQVDRTDPDHIVVKIRIQLSGSADDVAKVRAREQEIEDVLATPRLTVDVEFVEARAKDAYAVKLSTRWTVQNSWRPDDGPRAYAHETGHSLGLGDTYDYRLHCNNMEMAEDDRNYWCELGKQKAKEGFVPTYDLMGGGTELRDAQVDEIAGL